MRESTFIENLIDLNDLTERIDTAIIQYKRRIPELSNADVRRHVRVWWYDHENEIYRHVPVRGSRVSEVVCELLKGSPNPSKVAIDFYVDEVDGACLECQERRIGIYPDIVVYVDDVQPDLMRASIVVNSLVKRGVKAPKANPKT